MLPRTEKKEGLETGLRNEEAVARRVTAFF